MLGPYMRHPIILGPCWGLNTNTEPQLESYGGTSNKIEGSWRVLVTLVIYINK